MLLQELFLTQLLPDRKLKVLESQPLGLLPPGREGERRLLLWAVEDAVKSRYAQYVQLLEKARCGNIAVFCHVLDFLDRSSCEDAVKSRYPFTLAALISWTRQGKGFKDHQQAAGSF